MAKKKATQGLPRSGGTLLEVSNSGQEAWLYDDANCEKIRVKEKPTFDTGGMPVNFEQCAAEGLIVGYSVAQRDELSLTVYVGEPFTEKELSGAHWLEPQQAFLRLPSGKLCFESNDASRVGTSTPGAKGAFLEVPKGNYLLTLYRVDFEALEREGREWPGSAEIVLLTPGGTLENATSEILPFEARRDTNWIGKYAVAGESAAVLVWFGDDWDTCIVNLDSSAANALSLVPGSLLKIEVPDAEIKLSSVFAASWADAKRLPAPGGSDLSEYGYAAFCPMSDWDGAEALFCKRDTSTKRIPDECQNLWFSGTVKVSPPSAAPVAGKGRQFTPTDLATKEYYDSAFLSMVLADVLPSLAEREDVGLSEVLDELGKKLPKMDLRAQGDICWTEEFGPQSVEMSCRIYTGQPDYFAVVLASPGCFELLLLSEFKQGKWLATGLADDLAAKMSSKGADGMPGPNPRINFQLVDETLGEIGRAHRSILKNETAIAAPNRLEQAVEAVSRFLSTGFGR